MAFEACTNASGTSTRGIILRQNLQTGLTDVIDTNASVQFFSYELVHDLSMTPDGRFVVYVANHPVTNSIYCWDAQAGTNLLVSVSSDNVTPTTGFCDSPVVSANGQFVAFTSTATNLVANPLTGSCHIYLRDLSAGITRLLDTDTNGTGVGVEATVVPALSADGSVVILDSAGLLPDNRHLVHDVFSYNVAIAAKTLVSAAAPALESQTPNGISGFTTFSVSSNGQFVAFYSDADDLVANDTNGCRDVFVRDLIAGTNLLVSVSTNGDASGDGISTDPAISGDGRYVVFTSSADDLVPGDVNRLQDVFVRDLQAGTTTMVSDAMDRYFNWKGDSFSPSISTDGRYVLFHSTASLASGPFDHGVENLFVRDLQTDMTYPLTSSGVRAAAMTPDGQSVAFVGGAVGISGTHLYVWNSQSDALTYTNNTGLFNFSGSFYAALAISPSGQKIGVFAGSLQIFLYAVDVVANTSVQLTTSGSLLSHAGLHFSNDGRFLTCAVSSLNSAVQNVYLYDLQAGTNLLVSQNFNGTGAANDNSDSPNISPDGRFIAYRTFATNLVPFDFNNVADLFIYDAANGATILVSVNATGTASAADRSLNPVFSADGRMLFFQSWASDILGHDYNNGSDLFALDLTALPLTVSNGGGATNAESGFFAQLIPAGASSSAPIINWPLAAGKSYQVQYKTNLTDAVWLNLPGDVTYIGATGWLNDALPSPGQRFYRVVLNP